MGIILLSSGRMGLPAVLGILLLGAVMAPPGAAETEVRTTLELYTSAYRGRSETWYFVGTGLADARLASVGNDSIKAEAAVEFYPLNIFGERGGTSAYRPAVDLKRLWIKAGFPSWRLTAGKTKVAWGNGFVFNSGDILFGSLSPYVEFSRSVLRDDTAFLVAFNIPTGRFSYIEGVLLPPNLKFDGSALRAQDISRTSAGIRIFTRVQGWRIEGGYLYKGDAKVAADLLGHRPYVSIHGHAGIDLYAAMSLGIERNVWEDVKKTVNLSFGAFHQFSMGYDGVLTARLEVLLMPWQNWHPVNFDNLLDSTSGFYGIMIYPELFWTIGSSWTVGLQSLISPVDASAQVITSAGWDVFQGFTLLGYLVVNTGDQNAVFPWDRGNNWPADRPDSTVNGISITLGGRYSY